MRRALVLALAVAAAGCGGERDTPAPPPAAAAAPTAAKRPALCRALRSRVIGQVTDPSATELSGLVRSRTQRGLLWSHDDSGAGPELYALRIDGSVAARPQVTGAEAFDWEDIATGPAPGGGALLYVGDIGDNAAARSTIDVYRVAEPNVGAAATAPADRLTLRYPDRPHDAEALLVDPIRGDLVIVTKVIGGGRAYRTSARARAGTHTLTAGPSVDLSFVTAGDVSADGRIVVLRGYDRVGVWARRGRERLTATLARAPCVSPTSLSREGQGEAIALDRHGTSFVTVPEGSPAALRRYAPGG
jgi:hypothetical protein